MCELEKNLFVMARSLYGLSQSKVANLIDVPQQSYARYEAGIIDKIPYTIMSKLALVFNVSPDWLLTGTINKNHHAAIVAVYQSGRLFDNKPISAGFLAERLGVPEPFIQAIIAGDISPSQEFYDRMMHDGFGVEGPNDYHDRREAEIKKIVDRQAEQPREQVLVDEIEDLKGKLDEIYEWYDRLQKKSDALEKTALEQKGHIDALEKMIGFSINKGERKDNFDSKNHESS
jgi:transcriptional regulator with XRE-family HTH domain